MLKVTIESGTHCLRASIDAAGDVMLDFAGGVGVHGNEIHITDAQAKLLAIALPTLLAAQTFGGE